MPDEIRVSTDLTVLNKVAGLTTLSEVGKIATEALSSLGSPPQAEIATAGITDVTLALKIVSLSEACYPKESSYLGVYLNF